MLSLPLQANKQLIRLATDQTASMVAQLSHSRPGTPVSTRCSPGMNSLERPGSEVEVAGHMVPSSPTKRGRGLGLGLGLGLLDGSNGILSGGGEKSSRRPRPRRSMSQDTGSLMRLSRKNTTGSTRESKRRDKRISPVVFLESQTEAVLTTETYDSDEMY